MREGIKNIILCIVSFCVVLACGKRIENHQASSVNKSPIKYSQDDHSVACHSGEESCPEYIAFIKNDGINCNAVLVDEGTLVTSAYCFKDKSIKSLCENMEIIFPSTEEHEFQKLKCHELTFSQSLGELKQGLESNYSNQLRLTPASVAYIKVSTSARTSIQLSSNFQLDQSLKLQAYSFDIAYRGELFFDEKECYVSLKTYASPLYQAQRMAPVALTNCLGKQDELGAPILNGSGELVAINSGVFSVDEAQGLIERVKWDRSKNTRSVVVAQKAACLDIENLSLTPNCQNLLSQDDMNQKIHELFFNSLNINRLSDLKADLEAESLIRWESIDNSDRHWPDDGAFELQYEPVCRTADSLPKLIPYFQPQFKIKNGWRLGLDYIEQLIPLEYQADQIPKCL